MSKNLLTEKEYLMISCFIKKESGLDLGKPNDKEYLLQSRLEPLAQTIFNVRGLKELVQILAETNNQIIKDLVVEAMTTNETFFFRDPNTFAFLKGEYIKQWYNSQLSNRPLRVWSAAASSGQETFTLCMIFDELKNSICPDLAWSILATDLSKEMVERCHRASYNKFEVQRGLTTERLEKYFTKLGVEFVFKEEYRKHVQFEQMNLLQPQSITKPFDIVFCRNVLIYFDNKKKEETLEKISKLLTKDGILILGGTESLIGLQTPFESIGRSLPIFKRKGEIK